MNELAVFPQDRPDRTEADRSEIARGYSTHLPEPNDTVYVSNEDLNAMRAAFIRRFDERLPRTETLMAVANIGYRMALRDAETKTYK